MCKAAQLIQAKMVSSALCTWYGTSVSECHGSGLILPTLYCNVQTSRICIRMPDSGCFCFSFELYSQSVGRIWVRVCVRVRGACVCSVSAVMYRTRRLWTLQSRKMNMPVFHQAGTSLVVAKNVCARLFFSGPACVFHHH